MQKVIGRLDGDAPLPEGVSQILQTQLREFNRLRNSVKKAPTEENIHELRLSVRRMYTILNLFQGDVRIRKINKSLKTLKSLLRNLGSIRNHDIVLSHVQGFMAELATHTAPALQLLMARVIRLRNEDVKLLQRQFRAFSLPLRQVSASRRNKKQIPREHPSPSLVDDLRNRVPRMLTDFTGAARLVADHPKNITKIHNARLIGKPLRFLMETTVEIYPKQYHELLLDIKEGLRLMGEIHDIDMLLELLSSFRKELIIYNSMTNARENQIPASLLKSFLEQERTRRNDLLKDFSLKVDHWHTDAVALQVRAIM